MKALHYLRLRRSEAGVALLISIFVLMLISVLAMSLIVSSGTETSLAGNYRSSASVYYAALAGLEEGRGRLLPKNPNHLGGAVPSPLPVNKAVYILNPAPGEVVSPTDPAGSPSYPDTEYGKEFPSGLAGASVTITMSVSPIAGLPPALYKWVRINAVTEKSLNLDVNGDKFLDSSTPLYYDTSHVNAAGQLQPSLIVTLTPPATAVQALEVTSLAALPDGSQKLMQYVVAPVSVSTNANFAPGSSGSGFPAALTLLGSSVNNVSFAGPGSSQFQVNGNDQCGATSAVYGIGYTDGISSNPNKGSYSGAGNQSPNIVNLSSVPPNLQTPSGLDALVQTITQNADAVLTGPTDEKSLPSAMSAGNPMTVVVNGDFDLGNSATGFGVLVVTGKFNYDSDSSWKGVILVVGQGVVTSNKHGNGNGEIDGAILVAQTRDSSGNLLPDPNLGPASFTSDPTDGGKGIYYSSCWIKAAQTPFSYKILSYHQISQ